MSNLIDAYIANVAFRQKFIVAVERFAVVGGILLVAVTVIGMKYFP
ncbi:MULTISPECIES: hypothetical protein [Paraburkholderia]|uniref:Uncharacterized protein n=1 Tax=Paraburkholderia sartisoli TaxID=83784 RepID=A0A1H3Y5P8_9BURK|nr:MULTISPECIES: hypothetical protein [Paraburkholderia]SEA06172.1 hypothetical protein SAMN05192564_101148 [Paraburkholderia sartisoli]